MVSPPKYCLCIRTYISTLEAKTLWFWTSIRSSGAQDFSMLSYLVDLYCCLRAVSSFTRSEWGESMVLQVIVPWCDYLILVKIVNKLNERKLWVVCLYVHVFSVHRNLLSIQSKYTPALYATKPLREESTAPTAMVGLANLCDRGWRKKRESIGRPVQACGAGEG